MVSTFAYGLMPIKSVIPALRSGSCRPDYPIAYSMAQSNLRISGSHMNSPCSLSDSASPSQEQFQGPSTCPSQKTKRDPWFLVFFPPHIQWSNPTDFSSIFLDSVHFFCSSTLRSSIEDILWNCHSSILLSNYGIFSKLLIFLICKQRMTTVATSKVVA